MITWNKKINWIDSNYNTFNLRRRNYKPYTHKKIYEGGITKETFDLFGIDSRTNTQYNIKIISNIKRQGNYWLTD